MFNSFDEMVAAKLAAQVSRVIICQSEVGEGKRGSEEKLKNAIVVLQQIVGTIGYMQQLGLTQVNLETLNSVVVRYGAVGNLNSLLEK